MSTLTVDPSAVDPDWKFAVVLKAKLPAGVALNAAAHTSLGLAALAGAEHPELAAKMSFLNFLDADGGSHAPISGLSLVVLEGRAAGLRRFRAEARAAGLLVNDFVSAMTGDTYAEQLTRVAGLPEESLDYYAVAAFGRRDELDPLTKKFSLWK
ncbi:DUF2000 domain-containing protein [Streptacidiphilus rugosus]|uniref:DUF2000 domain-containing protein n=1 Tax=Streptacidiphilus rugosus TaxID=405783 RepID=UPI000A828E92|nr:DUF2000 domain-containing protein [Streptacidiphilus rugosus]